MAEIRTVPKPAVVRRLRLSPFWRHFLEMLGAMIVGMLAGAAIFLSIVQLTWDQALLQYPVQALLVMAASMSLPMVAWMRLRHHAWRTSGEMAAAMVIPVIPFICLVVFDVTKGALCGLYCLATVVAMLRVMLYRRAEYSLHR
ncbi:MAG: hypothetical protein ACM3QU_10795 [Verrucomicrobiota bacterium]